MTITELVQQAHDNAVQHGFWDDVEEMSFLDPGDEDTRKQYINRVISSCLMLITSELAEAQQELRHGHEDKFVVELADAVIRTADLAGFMKIDLENAIIKKMEYNKNRPYRHGKAF